MRYPQALFVTFVLMFGGAAAAAEMPLPVPKAEYSGNRVIESAQGTFTQKVHSAGGKERMETDMGGMQSVMILRPDKKLAWMLMPAQRMYMELDLSKAKEQSGSGPPADVTIEKVGAETVEGRSTTKYKMLMRDKSAGGFMWFTDEGIPIKMDMLSKEGQQKSRITMTLRDLKIGKQDASLFELPAGYSKMPNMGGMNPYKGN
jgi:outer membrane lipoprotein-sorting protein